MTTYRINPDILRNLPRRGNQFAQLVYRDHDMHVTPYSLCEMGDTPTYIEVVGVVPAYVREMLLTASC